MLLLIFLSPILLTVIVLTIGGLGYYRAKDKKWFKTICTGGGAFFGLLSGGCWVMNASVQFAMSSATDPGHMGIVYNFWAAWLAFVAGLMLIIPYLFGKIYGLKDLRPRSTKATTRF